MKFKSFLTLHRQNFFVHKENKNNNFIQQLFSSVLVFDACSQQYHNVCMCIPLLVNKPQRMHRGTLVNGVGDWPR